MRRRRSKSALSTPAAAPDEPVADAEEAPDVPEAGGDEAPAVEADAGSEAGPDADAAIEPRSASADVHSIDMVADELSLARAQLAAGLAGLAEGTLRRRIAFLEADGADAADELDALRVVLAEAAWRQGRLVTARMALDAIHPGSPQRRLPMATLIEAESLAAAGEMDRAAGSLERVVMAVGVDAAYELRAGVPGRLTWPLPSTLAPAPSRTLRPPWSSAPRDVPPAADEGPDDRGAAARGRLEEARVAYVGGDLARGDAEMSIAIRLDAGLAPDAIAIMEPTLGGQPGADRLLLYGDLLRAAGRHGEADGALDRAANRRS
jgi:hypothetical protein